ncbi:hypothetical protein BCR34DRAFT_597214 [Clohesyomyces aquaticus]|uniref:Uncharacterized protein n=1 Tax=Clohesyomyces aquaticus TaxID=1231657 RepID=A0A1Y2A3P0_9PLEO|nr:hypothetical protein BCR34DRAFT_597214 [Clohesyomyces aquaticus]
MAPLPLTTREYKASKDPTTWLIVVICLGVLLLIILIIAAFWCRGRHKLRAIQRRKGKGYSKVDESQNHDDGTPMIALVAGTAALNASAAAGGGGGGGGGGGCVIL